MRKRLIAPSSHDASAHDEGWLHLDRLAVVEVTSEDKDYPVKSALAAEEVRGWRAADSDSQTIRLILEPQRLTRIALAFEETDTERTQEFVLRWSGDGGRSFLEIVRQQWNFSPPNSTREVEDIGLNYPMSPCLNWSSCLTSVEGRLTLRSRICACLDLLSTYTLEPCMQREARSNPRHIRLNGAP